MPSRRELHLIVHVWLELARSTRVHIGPNADDPQALVELGRAAGLETAALVLLQLLQDEHRTP
jgi:hypothetical protein